MRVVSGVKPTGKMHLGNYLGAVKRFDKYDQSYIFVADYHSLNYHFEAQELQKYTYNLLIDYISTGLIDKDNNNNTEKDSNVVLFVQSQIPEVTELTFILSNYTSMGLLERAHAYKDALAKNKNINHGLFTYPVLMAADILLYKADMVPVGQDQKQHIEMTRDIAQKFNNKFGEVFKIPEADIQKNVATIPGLDGRKMSKSYNNTIEISLPPKKLKKKVMSIKTDSTPIEEPMDFKNCNVFQIYKYFATEEEIEEMKDKYQSNSFGYGHAKMELFDKLNEHFKPIRERRNKLLNNKDKMMSIIRENTKKARKVSKDTISKVRNKIGLLQN